MSCFLIELLVFVSRKSDLLSYLNRSAEMFKLAERYDILPEIFKLAAAIHEPQDYEVKENYTFEANF